MGMKRSRTEQERPDQGKEWFHQNKVRSLASRENPSANGLNPGPMQMGSFPFQLPQAGRGEYGQSHFAGEYTQLTRYGNENNSFNTNTSVVPDEFSDGALDDIFLSAQLEEVPNPSLPTVYSSHQSFGSSVQSPVKGGLSSDTISIDDQWLENSIGWNVNSPAVQSVSPQRQNGKRRVDLGYGVVITIPHYMSLEPSCTFFHMNDMVTARTTTLRNSATTTFEFYGRVMYSSRENFVRRQYFQFRDLFRTAPPCLAGVLSD
ncbi:hypothetical protein V2G26_009014 [Clonostachys chloroleuca]